MSGRTGLRKRRGQYAVVIRRKVALAQEFGRDLLARRFGERLAASILEELGVYKSGPRKGLPRGYLHWRKCEVGGWKRDAYGGRGGVILPGTDEWRVTLRGYDEEQTLAHCPDELGGPNDERKEQAILQGLREQLARRIR